MSRGLLKLKIFQFIPSENHTKEVRNFLTMIKIWTYIRPCLSTPKSLFSVVDHFFSVVSYFITVYIWLIQNWYFCWPGTKTASNWYSIETSKKVFSGVSNCQCSVIFAIINYQPKLFMFTINYTGSQKESIMLRFMLLSAYTHRQEAHPSPTAFRAILMNVLDRLRCVS